MRISDWSSDVCSSDLNGLAGTLTVRGVNWDQDARLRVAGLHRGAMKPAASALLVLLLALVPSSGAGQQAVQAGPAGMLLEIEGGIGPATRDHLRRGLARRSEEPTSELQSIMRTSYAG